METGIDTTSSRYLFMPDMTVQAMRDSRYRHPANAVAELIDNSIDATAGRIDILIQERRRLARTRETWRVEKLAVLDNGHGMDADTLVQALRFGGRHQRRAIHSIGKYGMGLPTSSVSQCRRLDVWTWQSDVHAAIHSYIDLEEIEAGGHPLVPDPDTTPIPEEWLSMASQGTVNPVHGTLVVWSEPDRITQRADTIFRQIEEEMGRIYRRFLRDGDISIRMASFRLSPRTGLPGEEPVSDRIVRPNDPLYLTPGSTVPLEEGMPDPMFEEYDRKLFTFDVDGREEFVEVVYSIAKQKILGEFKGDLPGNREYGKRARKNMGISVVRENREISLENYFVREGGGGSIPQNRWWGCEVVFGSGCDDLFGVDHNKQLVSHFASAMKYLDESDAETRQLVMDLGEDDSDSIYEVAGHIRNTTRAMMREIERMFKQRPTKPKPGSGGETTTITGKAENLVQEATRTAIEGGEIKPNQTDKNRDGLTEEEKIQEISETYMLEGYSEGEAQSAAENVVRDDRWYDVIATQLDGNQMFSFVSRGGTLTMKLNIRHPIYEFIQAIEDDAEGNEVSERTAIGLLAILLSWGRMEDDIEQDDIRIQVQERARSWGGMVSQVLKQVNVNEQGTG